MISCAASPPLPHFPYALRTLVSVLEVGSMLYSFMQFMRLRECSGAVGWRDAIHASMSQWNVWIVTVLFVLFLFLFGDEDVGWWDISWFVLLTRKLISLLGLRLGLRVFLVVAVVVTSTGGTTFCISVLAFVFVLVVVSMLVSMFVSVLVPRSVVEDTPR